MVSHSNHRGTLNPNPTTRTSDIVTRVPHFLRSLENVKHAASPSYEWLEDKVVEFGPTVLNPFADVGRNLYVASCIVTAVGCATKNIK